MQTSDQINELAAALAQAQGQIKGATKESANPFFRSTYANLEAVWEACRLPLTTNGLSLLQSPTTEIVGETLRVSVTTRLMHSSGQWIQDTLSIAAKEDAPQAMSSCVTYLKRVALMGFGGVAPTDQADDDAEAAQGRGNGQTAKPQAVLAKAPAGYREWLDDLSAVADEGTTALQAAWKASKAEYRAYLTATNTAQWDTLKARAAKVKGASVSA